ncbi:M42 family metallopeptidase [soil metagenome]
MNQQLLERLCQAPGIASRENTVRTVVDAALRPLVDTISVDTLGNLIAIRSGSGPRIMLAAHMDEIGFLVKHIDDKGFIRIQPVGGFDPRVLTAQRVFIHRRTGDPLPGVLQPGTKPIHLLQPGDGKELKLDDLFVDTGASAKSVRSTVSIGDMITLNRPTTLMGNTVVSKALDDRLGLYVMIEAVRAATSGTAEVIAVATTQEEVGLRGAQTAAFDLRPDIAIALDVTLAADIPGTPTESSVTLLGKGAAIKMFDSSQLPHPAIVDTLRTIAEQEDIPHQLEVLPRGGTDAGAIQRSRGGVYTGTISIPCRYVHTVNEMAHVDDVEACVTLLARFIETVSLDQLRHP